MNWLVWIFLFLAIGLFYNYWYIIVPIFAFLFYLSHKAKKKYYGSEFGSVNYDTLSGVEFEEYCIRLLNANGYSVKKQKPAEITV